MRAQAPRERRLNEPRPLGVQADERGLPLSVTLGGHKLAVESIQDRWRIDDEWWRERPVSRMYYELALEDGRAVIIFHDLTEGRWWWQGY